MASSGVSSWLCSQINRSPRSQINLSPRVRPAAIGRYINALSAVQRSVTVRARRTGAKHPRAPAGAREAHARRARAKVERGMERERTRAFHRAAPRARTFSIDTRR
jgi:hypothetical protein